MPFIKHIYTHSTLGFSKIFNKAYFVELQYFGVLKNRPHKNIVK